MRATWDIFCTVVDNFGDIGVSWRLARVLARHHGKGVRLWVDDLVAFHRIWPEVDTVAEVQRIEGVEIRAWRTPFAATSPADVVVEAFGCAVPETYLEAMSERMPPPVWINLEYLSAESWIASHHGLPSPHPRLPLTRHFFFPGYAPGTGGMIVEPDLMRRRDAFRGTECPVFRRALLTDECPPDARLVSLFAYENPALPALLDVWAAGTQPVVCLVPDGRVVPQVAGWFGVDAMTVGSAASRGALHVRILPFGDQDAYDHLLWACDLNFVRGEDSCARAQWAGRPMVWQAYPQDDRAHWDKVAALVALYTDLLPPPAAEAVAAVWRIWNGVQPASDLPRAWAVWQAHAATIEHHAEAWGARLADAEGLPAKLVEFVETRIQ